MTRHDRTPAPDGAIPKNPRDGEYLERELPSATTAAQPIESELPADEPDEQLAPVQPATGMTGEGMNAGDEADSDAAATAKPESH